MSSTRTAPGFFNQSRHIVSNIIESALVVKATSAVDGAVKAAFGIHYIFDLGYQLCALSTAHVQAFNITKFTITGLTFAISTYHGFNRTHTAMNYYEKASVLNEQLSNSDKILYTAEKIIKQSNSHLQLGGYQSFQQDEIPIMLEVDMQPAKSMHEQCSDSKPMLCLKALLDASVTATGVYYITGLTSSLMGATPAYDAIKNILIGVTLIGKTFVAYHERKMDLHAKIKAANLARDITPMINELSRMKKKLGTRQQLTAIIGQGEALTHQSIHLGIAEATKNAPLSVDSPLSISTPALMIKALLSGAVKASGVHYVMEIASPSHATLKYISAALTLLITSYRTYLHSLSDIAFHQQIISTQNTIDELHDLITLANKILLIEGRLLDEIMTEKKQEETDVFDDTSRSDITLSCDLDNLSGSSTLFSSSPEYSLQQPADIELCTLLGGHTDDPPRYSYHSL